MKDIKVGEYVISQNRLVIGQVVDIDKTRQETTIKTDKVEIQIGFWNILKHSFNLIDLLEVRRYSCNVRYKI